MDPRHDLHREAPVVYRGSYSPPTSPEWELQGYCLNYDQVLGYFFRNPKEKGAWVVLAYIRPGNIPEGGAEFFDMEWSIGPILDGEYPKSIWRVYDPQNRVVVHEY